MVMFINRKGGRIMYRDIYFFAILFVIVLFGCKTNIAVIKNDIIQTIDTVDTVSVKIETDIVDSLFLYNKLKSITQMQGYYGLDIDSYRKQIVKDIGLDYLKSDTVIIKEIVYSAPSAYVCLIYTCSDEMRRYYSTAKKDDKKTGTKKGTLIKGRTHKYDKYNPLMIMLFNAVRTGRIKEDYLIEEKYGYLRMDVMNEITLSLFTREKGNIYKFEYETCCPY